MNLKMELLGKNIRKARQNRNMTQEDLAESLNVSESAVSQWESGRTSPDLGIIPDICAVLDISSDWLLDIGAEKRIKEIEKIVAGAKVYSDAGQDEKAAEILSEGLKKYPSSDVLVYNLMYSTYENNKVIELGEWLLKNSTNDEYRHGAIQCLVYAYSDTGKHQKAEELAQKMPGLNICSNALLCYALTGEKRIRQIQSYRSSLINSLNMELFDEIDETVSAEKSIALIKLIFDKGDYGFYNNSLAGNYVILAKKYASRHEIDSTLQNLSEAANHALAFIDFVNHPDFKYSSILFEGMPGDTVLHYNTENAAKVLLEVINDPIFDFVRDKDEYKAISAQLTSASGAWGIK